MVSQLLGHVLAKQDTDVAVQATFPCVTNGCFIVTECDVSLAAVKPAVPQTEPDAAIMTQSGRASFVTGVVTVPINLPSSHNLVQQQVNISIHAC